MANDSRKEPLARKVRAKACALFEQFYRAGDPKAFLAKDPTSLEIDVLVVGGGAGRFLQSFVPGGARLDDPLHGVNSFRVEWGTLESGATVGIRFNAIGPDPFEGATGTGALAAYLGTSPAVVYAEGEIASPADVHERIVGKARGMLFVYGSAELAQRVGERGHAVASDLPPETALQEMAKRILQWASDPRNVRAD